MRAPGAERLPSSRHASGTADEGSITSFMRSNVIRIARTIPSSLQVATSSTFARIAASVRAESGVRRPSAIVARPAGSGSTLPERNATAASPALAGSAPNTRMPGFTPFAAIDVPERSPPPPTGATTTSSEGTSSRSSSAAVPCPAITSALSNGWTSVAPVSRSTSAHTAARDAASGAE